MARPKSWFGPKQLNAAMKSAKERGLRVYEYTRKTRAGKEVSGYYVGRFTKGTTPPVRLASPTTKIRWIRETAQK